MPEWGPGKVWTSDNRGLGRPSDREFTRRHLFGSNVRRFETMVVMGRMKFGTSVPMAGET